MLKTVEEIEEEIMRLLVKYDDDLVTTHDRMDFIVQQAEHQLEEYEITLNKHYADYDEEEYREEYLAAYREAEQSIINSTNKLLQKEAEGMLQKVDGKTVDKTQNE